MTDDTTRGEQLAKLRQEVDANPDSARMHLRLGTLLHRMGQLVEAQKSLEKATELDPQLYEAWGNLGGVMFSRWDFAGSAEANQKAVECNPERVQGHYNLGLANLYLGKAEEVIECFRRVLELDPEHAGGHYYLAAGLNALGKVEAAKVSLMKAESLGFDAQPELIRAIDNALKKEGGEGVLTMEIGDGPPKKG